MITETNVINTCQNKLRITEPRMYLCGAVKLVIEDAIGIVIGYYCYQTLLFRKYDQAILFQASHLTLFKYSGIRHPLRLSTVPSS